MRCTLVLEILHRRAISPSVRGVVLFSALIVAFASSGILFLPQDQDLLYQIRSGFLISNHERMI